MADFFALRLGPIWRSFKKEHFSFWAICGYLFVEYVRPQTIVHALDILPWGKVFIFLSLAAWLADGKRRWASVPLSKWMIAYLFVIIIASATAIWPQLSWSHFMDYFGWFLDYFLIISIVNTEKRLFMFLFIFLLASFKLSAFGAKTWAMRGFAFTDWGLMGPEGFFQNSGEFAVQMLVMLPPSYQMTLAMRPWLSRTKYLFMLAMPITAGMSVLGASSRGAQFGLAAQTYLTFLWRKLSIKAIAIMAVLCVVAYLIFPQEQMDRFRSMGDDKPSQQRLLYWKGGIEMIKEHPFLGVGFFNFAPNFALHHPDELLYGSAQLPHNIFIQVGTDAGALGLLVYVALIWNGFAATRAVRRRLQHDKEHWLYKLSYGYDASFVGYLIAGQFVTIGYYPFMWIHLALVAATQNIVQRMEVTAAQPAGTAQPPVAAGRRASL
jgi:O-antigen ligase